MELVLRRPPLGELQATAHDMRREYTVLTSLRDTAVPVPRTYAMCDDHSVIGAPFYIMEFVHGDVLRTTKDVLNVPVGSRRALMVQLVEVLTSLHTIDPGEIGMSDFGRPDGFMERQVRRWSRQFAGVQTRPVAGFDELVTRLLSTVPDSPVSSLLHGDYRLDNCVVRDSNIAAVLDWEMSTLGDPLADLSMFVVYHDGLADLPNPVVESPGRLADVPPLTSLLELYSHTTGYAIDDLDWYMAFAWFKLSVILEGVHARSLQGQMAVAGFNGVADLVEPSVASGLAAFHRRHLRLAPIPRAEGDPADHQPDRVTVADTDE
jgi:aminoglycoside phosphotransferase (APT) family kinase protein